MYSVTVETAIVNATKAPPSGIKWAGNMLMFAVDVKQGFVLKTTRFQMIQSRLFLLRDDNFIHGALFRFNTLQDGSFSKIHNRGTLMLIQS